MCRIEGQTGGKRCKLTIIFNSLKHSVIEAWTKTHHLPWTKAWKHLSIRQET